MISVSHTRTVIDSLGFAFMMMDTLLNMFLLQPLLVHDNCPIQGRNESVDAWVSYKVGLWRQILTLISIILSLDSHASI